MTELKLGDTLERQWAVSRRQIKDWINAGAIKLIYVFRPLESGSKFKTQVINAWDINMPLGTTLEREDDCYISDEVVIRCGKRHLKIIWEFPW